MINWQIDNWSDGTVLPEDVQCQTRVPTAPIEQGEVEGRLTTQVRNTAPLEEGRVRL